MRRAFPEAMIHDYEHLVDDMTNDPKDRHVLAAAVAADADLLVTYNLRHYPASACDPHDVTIQSPDGFLCDALERDPEVISRVLHAQAARKQRLPMTTEEMLDHLEGQLPRFVHDVRPLV